MTNYPSPGVSVREEDKSLYTKGQSTSIAGLIGVASAGPIGTPVMVTSLAGFEEQFGNARLDSYLYHGVKDFFEQGGNLCYVVRTAHYVDVSDPSTLTAVKPVATAVDNASTPAPAIRFSLPHGTFYNGYKVEVVDLADNAFDFLLRDPEGNLLESHRSILVGTASIGNDRYAEAYFPRASIRGMEVEDLGGVPVAGVYTFATGADGLTGLDDTDFIGSPTAKTGIQAFNSVSSIRLLAAPGITSPAFIQALITYCETRQNVIPIITTPAGLSPQEALNFRFGTGVFSHSAFNSNYAGLYWPWIIRRDPATRQDRPIPPEGTVMGIMARTDYVAHPWIAAAGKNRGVVRNALGVEYSVDTAENGELYDAQINVIRNFPESGVVVWGQKTLTNKPSAFDRMNVRRLFLYVENALKEASDYLVFEPNNPTTWNAFIRLARPLLADVQAKEGIYSEAGEPGFEIKCDETTNTPYYRDLNTMRALIYIRPVKSAEKIELVFVAAGSDTSAGFANLNQIQ